MFWIRLLVQSGLFAQSWALLSIWLLWNYVLRFSASGFSGYGLQMTWFKRILPSASFDDEVPNCLLHVINIFKSSYQSLTSCILGELIIFLINCRNVKSISSGSISSFNVPGYLSFKSFATENMPFRTAQSLHMWTSYGDDIICFNSNTRLIF